MKSSEHKGKQVVVSPDVFGDQGTVIGLLGVAQSHNEHVSAFCRTHRC